MKWCKKLIKFFKNATLKLVQNLQAKSRDRKDMLHYKRPVISSIDRNVPERLYENALPLVSAFI